MVSCTEAPGPRLTLFSIQQACHHAHPHPPAFQENWCTLESNITIMPTHISPRLCHSPTPHTTLLFVWQCHCCLAGKCQVLLACSSLLYNQHVIMLTPHPPTSQGKPHTIIRYRHYAHPHATSPLSVICPPDLCVHSFTITLHNLSLPYTNPTPTPFSLAPPNLLSAITIILGHVRYSWSHVSVKTCKLHTASIPLHDQVGHKWYSTMYHTWTQTNSDWGP